MINIPVSNGELIDKISILKIKSEKIIDEAKLKNINQELAKLLPIMESIGITFESELYNKLREINLRLWEIEDKIRLKEKEKKFDNKFIELARAVYYTNDERSRIKKQIDKETGSEITEEKSYEGY